MIAGQLGEVPDVVTPVSGRLTALLKSIIEHAQPLDEALLGDPALEAAVLGRARYLKALAEAARRTDVCAMAERLQTAHSATVEWICTLLAEEAPGGPAALRAPPIQRATGGATRTISRPVRAARESVNHTMSSAREAGEWARKAFSEATTQATRLGRAAREVATTGRNASLAH